jgi:hypothetical protein
MHAPPASCSAANELLISEAADWVKGRDSWRDNTTEPLYQCRRYWGHSLSIMPESAEKVPETVRKTLVVEDERIARMALRKILFSLGQDVDTAETVAEALSKVGPDIHYMLLDLMLPER